MNQGCPGPRSLGQGQVQPKGLAWDDTDKDMSLQFQMNAQQSESRSFRLVSLSFLLGGISRLRSCLSREKTVF